MRIIILTFFCLLFSFSLSAQNFGGNPASVKWKQVNTRNARVIFPAGLDSQANRIANLMVLLKDTAARTIGGLQKKWDIVLQNKTTIPNAYVRLAPLMSELYMTPPQNSFSFGSIRWDDNLIIHENRHMQQLSNFNKGFTRVFSFFLGEEGQLLANGMTVPDYFFEGDAVWQETNLTAQGRGRMPSFYNEFKSLWLGNKNYSWMKMRNGSYKDLVPDHYALGYQVIAYGYEKYGNDFWNKVTNDAVRFRGVFYAFNRAVERYSGKSYRQFCTDAMQYFKSKTLPAENVSPTAFSYLTKEEKNNVIDYQFASYISDDSILVTKKSYKEVNAFYILTHGKETRLGVRDLVIDDYYSYRNGKIVYAAYQSDARWANRDHSEIRIVDVNTGGKRTITRKSGYFSPDINEAGTEILAVEVKADGSNHLCRIDVVTGKLLQRFVNEKNYFFTQTKYINANTAVSAVRNPGGEMALVKINLTDGSTEPVTPFSLNVVGYPFVKGDTVYYTCMHANADKTFAVNLTNKKTYLLTNNANGVYAPAVNAKGDMLVSVFTAAGYRLGVINISKAEWKEISSNDLRLGEDNAYDNRQWYKSGIDNKTNTVTKYRKSFRLFNFHSRRPVVEDPEYGYSFFSDNVLTNFKNIISYTYNRADRSHTIGYNAAFAGWFPVLSAGAEVSFNRTLDTALGKSVIYNAAKLAAGVSIPLRFVGGRTNKFLSFGGGYNLEQFYFSGSGKNVFKNRSVDYVNGFLSFSNISQQARQHVNPRWAQTLSVNYRDAVNVISSHKLVAHASFYFPGISRNHSLVINTAYQNRDIFPDLFSKIFSYSRGYEALSTRRMYKVGVNYQLPLVYPDWGFVNLLYFQQIRANAFYDHTSAKDRVNNVLTEIVNRSTGAEIYFDTKIWNAYPVSFGVRFSHLLDKDRLNPAVRNRWEIILPVNLIPD